MRSARHNSQRRGGGTATSSSDVKAEGAREATAAGQAEPGAAVAVAMGVAVVMVRGTRSTTVRGDPWPCEGSPKIHRWAFGSAIPGVHTRRNWSARQVDNAAAPTASVRRASRSCSASASSGTQAKQQVSGTSVSRRCDARVPSPGVRRRPSAGQVGMYPAAGVHVYRYATELEREAGGQPSWRAASALLEPQAGQMGQPVHGAAPLREEARAHQSGPHVVGRRPRAGQHSAHCIRGGAGARDQGGNPCPRRA